MIAKEEYLDIVDSSDTVIGILPRTEVYKKSMNNFRVINAFLVNDKNEIWIPRRSASKKLFPLCLDASVGGHVSSGETYDEAFARELLEELNIPIDKYPYKYIGKLTPHTHTVSAFMNLYIIKTNDEPLYNTEDFVTSYWFSEQSFKDAMDNGDVAKGDLPILVEYVYRHL